MTTFNWKELQESQMKEFDKKYGEVHESVRRLDGGLVVNPVIQSVFFDNVKSHLHSTSKRSALAVIGEMRERIEKFRKESDKYVPFQKIHYQDALLVVTELLEELEKEVKDEEIVLEGYVLVDGNKPKWRQSNGALVSYTHQDENFSNLCAFEWCKCQQ